MSDFQAYLHSQEKVRSARWQHDYAGCKLELESIKMRLAEIQSQHQPLEDMSMGNNAMRKQMYAAAFYVVVGRKMDP